MAAVSKQDVSQRIKKLREYLNLTQEEFAEMVGTKKAAVSDWENGKRKPRQKTIEKISKVFGVNPSWLTTGTPPMFIKNKKPEQKPVFRKVVPIPVLNHSVPAGFPEEKLPEDKIVSYIYLPDIVPSDCYAVKVKGHSMYPTINDGDYVIFVTPDSPYYNLKNGSIVIVRNEFGDVTIKRYFKKDNGKAILRSDNPEYGEIEVNELCSVIGLVLSIVSYKRANNF